VLVVEHPDRRPDLHREQRTALERDEVVSAHHRPDPFLLEQPLEHVGIHGIRGDIDLLKGRHWVRRVYRIGMRRLLAAA